MKDYNSLEEALPDMSMLCLDLGESSNSIKQGFKDGWKLIYNNTMNYYIWVK